MEAGVRRVMHGEGFQAAALTQGRRFFIPRGVNACVNAENLRALRVLFEKRDIPGLKGYAGNAAREAFVRADSSLVDLSILAYSLAKLAEKPHIINSPAWKPLADLVSKKLQGAEEHAAKGEKEKARARVQQALNAIDSLSMDLGRFVSGIVEKARLRAAAQMYAHGASLGAACAFTGASKQDLASYVGETKMPEKYESVPLARRLDSARRLLEE